MFNLINDEFDETPEDIMKTINKMLDEDNKKVDEKECKKEEK